MTFKYTVKKYIGFFEVYFSRRKKKLNIQSGNCAGWKILWGLNKIHSINSLTCNSMKLDNNINSFDSNEHFYQLQGHGGSSVVWRPGGLYFEIHTIQFSNFNNSLTGHDEKVGLCFVGSFLIAVELNCDVIVKKKCGCCNSSSWESLPEIFFFGEDCRDFACCWLPVAAPVTVAAGPHCPRQGETRRWRRPSRRWFSEWPSTPTLTP